VNAESTGNSFTQRALWVYRAGYQNYHKEDIRVTHVLLHATGASSLQHWLVSNDPFQGQQLPAFVLQVRITGWCQTTLFRANSCQRVSVLRQQKTVVLVRECREHIDNPHTILPKLCMQFSPILSHVCYMIYPLHPPWLDHSNYIWQVVEVTELFAVQFSPSSSKEAISKTNKEGS
jgi:hypothetical protein